MSNSGKMPPKGTVAGGKKAPPTQDGFTSLVSFWEQSGDGLGGPAEVDPLEELREKEAELIRRSEEIIANARAEATRIEEEAYQKGFAQGEAAGQAEGKKIFDDATRQLGSVFSAIEGQLTEKNSRYEDELLLLVKTMVDRLVQHEVSTNPRVIQACLMRALSFVVEKSVVRVHLHPDDFSRIREASLENPALLEGKRRIELMEDGSVGEGGCFLETDFGDVDASMEHGREKLYEAVDQAFRVALAGEVGGAGDKIETAATVDEPAEMVTPVVPEVESVDDVTATLTNQPEKVAPAIPAESESAGSPAESGAVAD